LCVCCACFGAGFLAGGLAAFVTFGCLKGF
jgi:hypothetical protein